MGQMLSEGYSYFHLAVFAGDFFERLVSNLNAVWKFKKNLVKMQVHGNRNAPSEIILPHCGMQNFVSYKVTILKASFYSVIVWI